MRNTWPPRRASASNSAARRRGSKCAAISSRSAIGAMPDMSRDEARVGEREPDDQRLLLAGRGAAGRRVLGPMPDREIAEMRADQRAAGGGVAAAVVAQDRPVAVLGVQRRPARPPAPRPRLRARAAPRERARNRHARRRSAPRAGARTRAAPRRPRRRAQPLRARSRRARRRCAGPLRAAGCARAARARTR